ncbi:MAG: hypothetical protein JKY50_00405 [Oleispira sp.]|nr:hypothetical protein [Oleispira sp.]
MATTKQEFVDLADELINLEFADFRNPLAISKDGSYNPVTDIEEPPVNFNMMAIPLDIKTASEIFDNVTNASIYLVAYKGDTEPQALDASFTCVYQGKAMSIESVEDDSANASWYFRLAK